MLRALSQSAALFGALSVASCSVLLDWNGYTGGEAQPITTGDAATANAPTGDATTQDSASTVEDATSPTSAMDVAEESKGQADAPNETLPDVAVPLGDGAIPHVDAAAYNNCGSATCEGCCLTTSYCAGGRSADRCGANGQPCQSCLVRGEVCSSESTCVMAPPDGGSEEPSCKDPMADCSAKLCIPVVQDRCCKSDETCGCQVNELPVPVVPPAFRGCL